MAIKAKNTVDFYSLLSVALLVLFNACTTVKRNGYKFLMNAMGLSIMTLWNRWCSGKIGIGKYLRNHYYLRKFSTIVRQKKGTMESTFFQPHFNLDFFKLPEQGSREDALPTQRDYLLSIM